MLPVQAAPVELTGKGIVNPRARMPDFCMAKNRTESQLIELPFDLCRINGNRLDLGLDVLFLICQEFIDLAIALD